MQYHTTTIPFTTTAPPPQPNEYHPPPHPRYRCGGLKPLHLPHSSWRYFRRKLRSWAPNRSPATVCSGQILCLPLYLSIFIVTLTYIHTLRPALLSISLNGPKIISQGHVQESSRSHRTCVWRQSIHIYTYIHTYIRTYKHLFLHSMGGGCPSLPPTAEDAHALGDTPRSMGGFPS